MKIIHLLTPVLFIILGVLIEFEYYEPSRRMGGLSPWFLIILGVLGIFMNIYLEYFHKNIKETVIKYDFKSKITSVLLVISIGTFFLFSFESIFSTDAMNDIFRLLGLFGIIFSSASIFQKDKKNKS